MAPKRSIHITFEDDDTDGDKKRQRQFIVRLDSLKLVFRPSLLTWILSFQVLIDEDATIEHLATEISTFVGLEKDNLKLQLAGFELRTKEYVGSYILWMK